MTTRTTLVLATALIASAIAGATSAQEPEFPNEKTKPASCEDFRWNDDMTRDHPRVKDACQETVLTDGLIWARLEARFVRVRSDGMVVFSIRGKNNRVVEDVMMEPAPDQVAFIDNRATEFRNLRTSDVLNLYVPEGEYGWVTQPVATTPRFKRAIIVEADQADAPSSEVMAETPPRAAPEPAMVMADNRPLPSRLPTTAGNSYWLLLIGGLLTMCGIGATVRRQF